MSLLPYNSSGWLTHRECKLRELDFPLFDQGEETHFTVQRFYCGPRESYVPAALDTVDAIYDGVAAAITGTAAGDEVVFAAAKKFLTGDPVLLTVSSGLAGLTTALTYYLIRTSNTVFKLATTRANAIAGTAVNITSDGTGTLTPPAAYLVSQSKLSDSDADQVRYDRMFASVPAQWSDPQSRAYPFPALLPGTTASSASVTSIAAAGTNQVILGTAVTGVAVNDTVVASVRYTRGGIIYNQTFQGKVAAINAGVSVTIPGNLLGSVGSASSVTGTVAEMAIGRDSTKTLIAAGRLVHDYARSSVAALPTDLPLFQVFAPVTSAGFETDSLTATTIPTNTDYFTLVNAGGEIVVECAWDRYLGNIFVRKTRMVSAQ